MEEEFIVLSPFSKFTTCKKLSCAIEDTQTHTNPKAVGIACII